MNSNNQCVEKDYIINYDENSRVNVNAKLKEDYTENNRFFCDICGKEIKLNFDLCDRCEEEFYGDI